MHFLCGNISYFLDFFFFFQAEDGIRDYKVTGVQTCALPIFLGANGAGKTTTLRAVSGLVSTEGSVHFAGGRIDGRAPEDLVRAGIAHVPEGRGTFVGLTVEENLRLGAYARRGRTRGTGDFERVYQYFPI